MEIIRFREDILPLKNQLYRLALRITLNPAEAEDVVQEVLLKVWNKRREWGQLQSIEAYCLTLTRNMAIDRGRSGASHTQSLTDDVGAMADKDNPHESLVQRERMNLIDKIINDLPVVQRAIVQLRDIEGKSYAEIAKLLSMTEGQVKVKLHRARQQVKKKYLEIERYGL